MVHTKDQLEAFARQHFAYEIGAAANEAIAWYYSPVTMSRAVQSALMSATLVHLRLLADFVCRAPRGDDVAASHYVVDWEGHDPLGFERTTIDGHVAHLTMRREDRRMWNPIEVARSVFFELQRFLDEVSKDADIKLWFANAIALLDEFMLWSEDSGDWVLEKDLAVDDEVLAGDQWWLSLPTLPVRVRGS